MINNLTSKEDVCCGLKTYLLREYSKGRENVSKMQI